MKFILPSTVALSGIALYSYNIQNQNPFISPNSISPGSIVALRRPYRYETLVFGAIGTMVEVGQSLDPKSSLYTEGYNDTTHFAIALSDGRFGNITPSGFQTQSLDDMSSGRSLRIFTPKDTEKAAKIAAIAERVVEDSAKSSLLNKVYNVTGALGKAANVPGSHTISKTLHFFRVDQTLKLVMPSKFSGSVELSSYCSKAATQIAKEAGALSSDVPDEITPKALEHLLSQSSDYVQYVCTGEAQYQELLQVVKNPNSLGIPDAHIDKFHKLANILTDTTSQNRTRAAYEFMSAVHKFSYEHGVSFKPFQIRTKTLGFVGPFDPTIVERGLYSFTSKLHPVITCMMEQNLPLKDFTLMTNTVQDHMKSFVNRLSKSSIKGLRGL